MAKWTAEQQRWVVDENATLYYEWEPNGNDYYFGMDFSLTSTGISVLDGEGELVESVAIETKSTDGTKLERLTAITEEVKRLLEIYPPVIVAVEAISVSRNVSSMMDLCTVSGAILQLVYDNSKQQNYDLPYLLYCNVSSLKKAAAKDGGASKGTMQLEVYIKWSIKTETDDEADAITAAKLAYKLDGFFESYHTLTKSLSAEDKSSALMDICKNRHEEFYELCTKQGILKEEADALIGIFTGSRSGRGGSGLNQLRENQNDFYYAARKRLKEK